jgi:hypothetical protein
MFIYIYLRYVNIINVYYFKQCICLIHSLVLSDQLYMIIFHFFHMSSVNSFKETRKCLNILNSVLKKKINTFTFIINESRLFLQFKKLHDLARRLQTKSVKKARLAWYLIDRMAETCHLVTIYMEGKLRLQADASHSS